MEAEEVEAAVTERAVEVAAVEEFEISAAETGTVAALAAVAAECSHQPN